MKKIVVGIVVLVFLLLFGILAYKLSRPDPEAVDYSQYELPLATEATGADSQSPDEFAKSFYQWYIINISRNPYFPSVDVRSEVMEPWTTKEFLKDWRLAEQTLEGDYILQSGDEDPLAAGADVTTSIVSQSVQRAVVKVSVGAGPSPLIMRVEVVRGQDGSWKINSIFSP
ncbi:MAG: hypothetical protein QOE22_38 [Candidatus Parcubacteria bacterium]|jgi:hypothetical protein|nr:hypothetical protein [Candidatus Parcubacteria bacterium]